MAKTKTVATRQARRAVPYIDVAPRVGEVTLVTPAQLAARHAAQRAEYTAWRQRQDELAERDRKVRRFLLGLGLSIGTGLLTGVGVAGWLVWHALTTAGAGLIAVPLILLGAAALAVGGHRCVTIVQHWH
jgi:F0F1-type ATP synthase assembly protein I